MFGTRLGSPSDTRDEGTRWHTTKPLGDFIDGWRGLLTQNLADHDRRSVAKARSLTSARAESRESDRIGYFVHASHVIHEGPQSSPGLFPPRWNIQRCIPQPNPSSCLPAPLGPNFPRNNGFSRSGPRSSAQRNGRRDLQPLENMRRRPSFSGTHIPVPRV